MHPSFAGDWAITGRSMVLFKFKTFALATVGLCLAGCSMMPKFGSHEPAPPPPPVAKPVRSIAILSVAEPQSEQILNVGSALGASSDTTLTQPHIENSTAYTQMLAARNILFGPDVAKTVAAALAADGYAVTYLPEQRSFITADGKSEELSQLRADADAILVIRFTGAGYVSSPVELSYQPWITVSARLIRSSNREDIYFKTFSGGYPITTQASVNLPSSSKYRYPYFRDLTKSVDESIRGLKDSANDIAVYLAGDLFQGAHAAPKSEPPASATPPGAAPAANPGNSPVNSESKPAP